MRAFYTALFYAATPLILGRLWWRSLKVPAYRQRILERFGIYSRPPSATGSIWLHAVSVGEAEAAFPLLRELQGKYPGIPFLVTTTTPTGSARVREVLGNAVDHVYLPYDLPVAVGRFLDAFQPRMAMIMETEIWPNLYRAIKQRNVPLIIVNGRLSERSARGYSRILPLTAASLSAVNWVAAQSKADAARFVALGAPLDRVDPVGNIKFDMTLPADIEEASAELRSALFGARPVVIAGSTHEGEEQFILAAARELWKTWPDLVLILAPRHPERFSAVAEACRRDGLAVTLRSDKSGRVGSSIFLLDTIGELRMFYGVSDVAFVGGSLVAKGGHNLLEPVALGVPVIFGPHMFNFRDMTRGMLEAGGGVQITDAADLAPAISQLLGDPGARLAMATRGRAFFQEGRGALKRVAETLSAWLDSPAKP